MRICQEGRPAGGKRGAAAFAAWMVFSAPALGADLVTEAVDTARSVGLAEHRVAWATTANDERRSPTIYRSRT